MAARTGLSKSTIGRIWREFEPQAPPAGLIQAIHRPVPRGESRRRRRPVSQPAGAAHDYSQLHRRHRAIEFRKFLLAIDKAVAAGLDVHLVCGNYATHNTDQIRTWLARHPRFRVHFTPTGSSWMNQVERWSAC
jgi:hypothetical protein